MHREGASDVRPATGSRSSLALGIALLLAMTGCQSPKKAPAALDPAPEADAPLSNTDPCAARLHDLSGLFLLYLREHNDLPERLDQLAPYAKMMGLDADFACPVSGLAYAYSPNGILLPEKNERIIVYDASPVHAKQRWVITLGTPTPEQPPRTNVVHIPESFFLLRPPTQ